MRVPFRPRSSTWVIGVLVPAACAGFALADSTAADQARQLIALSQRTTGLCVHLGAGREGSASLTAELAQAGGMVVHGLAADDESLARARNGIESRNVRGQASAERLPLNPLPYVRDLANLVVIEDLESLTRSGLSMDEVRRITCPGGVICIKQEGRWTASTKPRPREMDDWTHPAHGPDGNRVSADGLIAMPLGLRWLDGLPLGMTDTYNTSPGWVIAGGRIFVLGPTDLDNLAPAGFLKNRHESYLVARDAFNGLPLWKVACGPLITNRMVSTYNFAPLATDGRRVYLYRKDGLVALEAETGQLAVQYQIKFRTERLLLADNVLVSSEWTQKEAAKDAGHGLNYAAHWVITSGTGAVEAFDAREGKLKWSLPSPAQEMVASDGALFMLLQSGNPPAGQQLVAVDLQTGKERWRLGPENLKADPAMHLNCAGRGVLVVARIKAKTISIHSAADGRMLWEIKDAAPAGSPFLLWTPMVDGLLWQGGNKHDPLTGEVKSKAPPRIDAKACCPAALVGRYLVDSRGSSFLDLGISKDHPERYRYISYHSVRGACIMGTTPANGMLYAGQNRCRCVPGQVPGFVAFGPCGSIPTKADFEKARATEQGPALGTTSDALPAEDDWPMYRHDAQRSGATKGSLPDKLRMLWRTIVAPASKRPLAEVWKSRLTPWLSAPVVAEGKVFVAATDLGQIVAVDAASGHVTWRGSVHARIDSPPAIYRGLCVVGAHDGNVHAMSTGDGRLAWRVSVAPWHRRMLAFGQIESVWPAVGAVLIQDGAVYATAGRSTESDGGLALCALDASTGQQRWGTGIGQGTFAENDVLSAAEGKLLFRHVKIDPKTGALEGAGKRGPGGGLEPLHDGTWTRLGNTRSGARRFGRATAEMFVWNDTTVFGYECLVNWNARNRWCFAVPRARTTGEGTLRQDEHSWRVVMPDGCQVEAMAMCSNRLVLAGRVCDPGSGRTTGFLWVISPQEGKRLAEFPLESPPAYDGLAIAGGRVYLSLEDGSVMCLGE